MGLLARLLPRSARQWLRAALAGDEDDRFERIFDASPDWIVITRLSDSTVVTANRGFQTLSGYPLAEVVGQPLSRFNVWVSTQQRTELVTQMMANGEARNTLVQLRRKDGEVLDCIVNCTLLALEGTEKTHALWIARDVTGQIVAQEWFGAAFRLTPNFISISRLSDGRYVEVNAAFERMMGYTRDEVLGRTSGELGIWADKGERDRLVLLLRQQQAVNDHFIRVRAKDGRVMEALANVATFESRGERFMIGVLRDVTAEREAERILQDSEARFSRLFDQSPLPMCYFSSDDQFAAAHWNQSAFDAFGLNRATDQGRQGDVLGIWAYPADRQRFVEMSLRREIVSGEEVQMRRSDGQLLWMAIYTRIISDARREMMVYTYVDVTERRNAQNEVLALNSRLEERVAKRTGELQSANLELSQTLETLRLAKDQLVQSEKLAALGALVAGVAHELNTPIGNGLTMASTLEHKVQVFEKVTADGVRRSDLKAFVDDTRLAAEVMRRNLERAGALVVTFKQVAVDQTSSHRRRFQLSAVVGEILVTLAPALRKSDCTVQTQINDELWLDSYPGPLGQVLTNLINNAMLHAFETGKPGRIDISASAPDTSHVSVQLRDNGRGIHPDDQRRVFEPFFTTKLGQGGSGLGLHIVHNIVTSILGGHIALHSAPGEGTTFTLTLPLSAPERAESGPVPLS